MGVSFKGAREIVALLLEHGAAVNVQNYNGATALIYAATYGQLAVAEMLLAAGADKTIADVQGHTALSHAQQKGFGELVALLAQD